jgi:hypothetical protein
MSISVRAVRAGALTLLVGLMGALPAAAIPVYADGTTGGEGFDPADVAAAIAAGADAPTVVTGIAGDPSSVIESITTPLGITGSKGKNKANPSRGTSTWTITIADDAPEEALDNLALVILGHSASDPLKYKHQNVGLDVETDLPWLFVTPGGVSVAGTGGAPGPDGPIYVAFLLGDVEAGGTYHMPIEYLLGQKLKKAKNEAGDKVLMFPLYAYSVVSVPAPEPSTLALLAFGALAVGFAARRAR